VKRMEPCFRELNHTADLAVEVWGEDFSELLAHAAEVVFALQGLPEPGGKRVRRRVELTSPDREALLVDWLNELLYLSETNGEMYASFQIVHVSDTSLKAAALGCKGRPTKRKIKAATFHALQIADSPGRCAARIVFDV